MKIRVDLSRRRGYQCRMFAPRPKRILGILLLLFWMSAPVPVWPADSDTATPERPAEYMIYQ